MHGQLSCACQKSPMQTLQCGDIRWFSGSLCPELGESKACRTPHRGRVSQAMKTSQQNCRRPKQNAPIGLHSAGYPEVWQQLRGTCRGSRILQRAEPLQHVFQANLHAAPPTHRMDCCMARHGTAGAISQVKLM